MKPADAKTKVAVKPVAKKVLPRVVAVDYSKMTVAELKAEAKKKDVLGISAMKKADLIKALSK